MLTNTIAITALLLAIILVVPIVCRWLRIPSIVGLILTGVLVGPYGLGILMRNEVIDSLSQIGILYIMFLSGIEIDMDDFRQERKKGLLFGLMTFFIPLLLGFIAFSALGFGPWSCLLAASILGSHTLMTYTTVSKYSIHKNAAVSITVGATIVAVTLAMIILALVSSHFRGGEGLQVAVRFVVGTAVMVGVVFGLMPPLIRWCFHRTNDAIQQWLLTMTMAVVGGLLAYAAGMEPILGVFLTALSLNRLIPNQSPLMNRITFAGNALFVPVFLIGVGMLIDLRVFVQGWEALLVAGVMVAVAIGSKGLAALLARKTMHLSREQGRLLFGLTNSHAAGALASVMIGYGILCDGWRLLPESILNATIILILVSCAVSSFVTEHAARDLHEEAKRLDDSQEDDILTLLPAVRTRDNRKPKDLVTVLQESRSKIPPEDRVKHVVLNFPNATHGYGGPAEALLKVPGQAVWLCQLRQALTSFTSVRVLIPEHAEADPAYRIWQQFVERLVVVMKADVSQEVMHHWQVLPRLESSMSDNELLLLIQARPETPSYNPQLDTVPDLLREHFADRSFVVLFPAQEAASADANALIKQVQEQQSFSFIRRLREKFN